MKIHLSISVQTHEPSKEVNRLYGRPAWHKTKLIF